MKATNFPFIPECLIDQKVSHGHCYLQGWKTAREKEAEGDPWTRLESEVTEDASSIGIFHFLPNLLSLLPPFFPPSTPLLSIQLPSFCEWQSCASPNSKLLMCLFLPCLGAQSVREMCGSTNWARSPCLQVTETTAHPTVTMNEFLQFMQQIYSRHSSRLWG